MQPVLLNSSRLVGRAVLERVALLHDAAVAAAAVHLDDDVGRRDGGRLGRRDARLKFGDRVRQAVGGHLVVNLGDWHLLARLG